MCFARLNDMSVLIHMQAVIMSTPLGGGHIIFAFSAVRRPT